MVSEAIAHNRIVWIVYVHLAGFTVESLVVNTLGNRAYNFGRSDVCAEFGIHSLEQALLFRQYHRAVFGVGIAISFAVGSANTDSVGAA